MSVCYKGKVQAKNRLELKFSSSGKLKELFVSEGDKVKKGQVLAKLDDSPIQNQLDSALLSYRKTRAKFDEFDLKHSNPPANDQEKFEKEQLQADLDSSVKEVEAAKYELDQLELKSPIDGVVEKIENLYPGLNITPGTQTITVVDPSNLNFIADVSEMDIPSAKVGSFAKVVLDAYPNDTIGGKILSVGIIPTGSKDVSYPVEIELPQRSDIKIGFSGSASID